MQLPTILSALLGLSKAWRVTDIAFSDNYRRLEVTIDFFQDDYPACRNCNMRNLCTEKESGTWFNQDFLSYETYLHSRTPCCRTENKIIPPWVQTGSKFIKV